MVFESISIALDELRAFIIRAGTIGKNKSVGLHIRIKLMASIGRLPSRAPVVTGTIAAGLARAVAICGNDQETGVHNAISHIERAPASLIETACVGHVDPLATVFTAIGVIAELAPLSI